jgi:hypothetical protein
MKHVREEKDPLIIFLRLGDRLQKKPGNPEQMF